MKRGRWMSCWLATNELDLLDSGGRGFRERLHPLISRDESVTLTWPTLGVAVAAFELAVARYLEPHEMRITQRMASICYDGLHVAPLARTQCAPPGAIELPADVVRPQIDRR